MKQETFNTVVEQQLKICSAVLVRKASEYAANDDRLSNFKAAAILQQTTAIKALGGMLAKHIIALFDFIERDEEQIDRWEEKITDTINYCILLRALLLEEKKQ